MSWRVLFLLLSSYAFGMADILHENALWLNLIKKFPREFTVRLNSTGLFPSYCRNAFNLWININVCIHDGKNESIRIYNREPFECDKTNCNAAIDEINLKTHCKQINHMLKTYYTTLKCRIFPPVSRWSFHHEQSEHFVVPTVLLWFIFTWICLWHLYLCLYVDGENEMPQNVDRIRFMDIAHQTLLTK